MATSFPGWLPPVFSTLGRVSPGLAARLAAELIMSPRGQNPPQEWELEPGIVAHRSTMLPAGIHALWWGESGPVVLAQHGWRGRPTQFRVLAEYLVPRGFQVVALTGPGHGLTPGRHATPRLVARAMLAASRDLPPVAAVVGHSMGGAAAGIALELGLPASRVVMIGSPSAVSGMIDGFAVGLALPSRALDRLRAIMRAHAGRPVEDFDLVMLGPRQTAAALIVHDEDDDVISVDESRRLAARWPGARTLYTRGRGHRELLKAPEVAEAVADFVSG